MASAFKEKVKQSLVLGVIRGGLGWRVSKSEQTCACPPCLSSFPVDSALHSDQPFPTQMDLISTIGESAALGAAGVILWGDAGFTTSTVSKTHPTYRGCRVCRDRQRVGALGYQPQGGQA